MSEATGIGWTEKTWNPWQGCTKVSPGCAHCYMFTEKTRYKQDPSVVVRSAPRTFLSPLRWKNPEMVFTCSWSDFFHEGADAWRDEAWDIIDRTPHLTYQILTKRPERIRAHLPKSKPWGIGWPNVWLGVSVENQRHAYRAALLSTIPAFRRFVSAEPLLGPLRLDVLTPTAHTLGRTVHQIIPADYLDWVIVGGESGPDHRPMDLDWARSLRDQCERAGVAFYFKQLGGPTGAKGDHAAAVLDGRTHVDFPH